MKKNENVIRIDINKIIIILFILIITFICIFCYFLGSMGHDVTITSSNGHVTSYANCFGALGQYHCNYIDEE